MLFISLLFININPKSDFFIPDPYYGFMKWIRIRPNDTDLVINCLIIKIKRTGERWEEKGRNGGGEANREKGRKDKDRNRSK